MGQLVEKFRAELEQSAQGGSLEAVVKNYELMREAIITIRDEHTATNRLLRGSASAEKLNQSKAQAQLEALEEAYYQLTSEVEHEIIVPPEPKKPILKNESLNFAQWLSVVIPGAVILGACLLALISMEKTPVLSFLPALGAIPTRIFLFFGFAGLLVVACHRYTKIIEGIKAENKRLFEKWHYEHFYWESLKKLAERRQRTSETRKKLLEIFNEH